MRLHYAIALTSLLAFSQSAPVNELDKRVPLPDAAHHPRPTSVCPDYCAGTNFNASLAHWYVCGDSRLGPIHLPTRLPLSGLFGTYDRFGGLCPGVFLGKWFDSTSGFFIYPPENGFQLNTAGAPISGDVTLPVGLLIDRFGSEYGTFVSPEGAPYMQRALPPSNLDTPKDDQRFPYNYHVYKVSKPFNAKAGPIAEWFGQPGQGVQYQLNSKIIDLLAEGFIEPVDLNKF